MTEMRRRAVNWQFAFGRNRLGHFQRTASRRRTTALFVNEHRQVAVLGVEDRLDMLQLSDALRDDMAVFVENATQRVHEFRALVDKALTGVANPRSKRRAPRLMRGRSGYLAIKYGDNHSPLRNLRFTQPCQPPTRTFCHDPFA